jgi:hypothetical protein
MTDRRTKFVRKNRNGNGWEYGYTEAEIRLKERKVTDQVVGQARTLADATAAWLEQKPSETV